jgi:hypothetical protein
MPGDELQGMGTLPIAWPRKTVARNTGGLTNRYGDRGKETGTEEVNCRVLSTKWL